MSGPETSLSQLQGGHAAEPFRSILFGGHDAPPDIDECPEPRCFRDLNLDQVIRAMTADHDAYRLAGYFHLPLSDVDAVDYRQEVFQDLEQSSVYDVMTAFAAGMRAMREALTKADKAHHRFQKGRWFLDAITEYCVGVSDLTVGLDAAALRSRGLQSVRSHLAAYVTSSGFSALQGEASDVRRGLDAIRYNLHVKADRITVGRYEGETDYGSEISKTFERFRQGAVDARKVKASPYDAMNHIEAAILDLVARVFPGEFAALDSFCQAHVEYVEHVVGTFDREVQFYVAYLDYIAPLRAAGLALTYPVLSADSKTENAADTFDLALAAQLVGEQETVVCNDVRLTDSERILVVSGPNNGGKTTLARTIGQLHYLAKLGCPVPGNAVRLFLCDAIYTHFEKEEDIDTLAGKLQEELNRMREDFDQATPRSLMIMNEMFSSTTLHDALFLSKEVLGRLSDLDALGVCVTFIDELASLNPKTVSMVSTVVPDDPATRTYKLVRRPADGRAYARALAERYELTYEKLTGRITR